MNADRDSVMLAIANIIAEAEQDKIRQGVVYEYIDSILSDKPTASEIILPASLLFVQKQILERVFGDA